MWIDGGIVECMATHGFWMVLGCSGSRCASERSRMLCITNDVL